MKNKNKFWLLTLLSLFVFSLQARAEEGVYTVDMIPNEHQFNKESTYFDLRLKPSQKTTIKIQINNFFKEESSFHLSLGQAYTNNAMAVDYLGKPALASSSRKVDFLEVVRAKSTSVKVPANKGLQVSFDITMPDKKFDGMLLGGIYISKDLTEEEKKTNGFVNRFSYIKPIKITETDTKVKANVELKGLETKSSKTEILVLPRLENPTSALINKAKVTTKITNRDSKKVVKELVQENASIAPNSLFDYTVRLTPDSIESGNYSFDMTIDSPQGKWHFTKDFSLSIEKVKDLKKELIKGGIDIKGNEGLPNWAYALIGVLAASLLFGFFLFFAKRKKKKEEEEIEKEKEIERLVQERLKEAQQTNDSNESNT